ncbi:alpha/beta hydrolase family protein, partial [Hoylesella enoeca]
RKDLYVDHSPLFNADKIHTPLLFLHGTSDTNVPIGESIQMFTALKLLGRPTAFVAVEGEDHWIMDYRKRVKWQNTIFAWFAKWLKNDPAWWNDMYREKPL